MYNHSVGRDYHFKKKQRKETPLEIAIALIGMVFFCLTFAHAILG